MKAERHGKTKEIENHAQNSCDGVGKGQRSYTAQLETRGHGHLLLLTNLDTRKRSVTENNCELNCELMR